MSENIENTDLMIAINKKNNEKAQLLIQKGANLNIQNNLGDTL